MGSSGSESVDCGVGSLVWVRRRNGSWWPGKILGPDDLSNAHLMSPRSGTPVKLLGREDASVDWYNLEKSKRVKAFRCGDFDECIERAESSVSMPSKKREKYARREDAILHALELEKQMMDNQEGRLDIAYDIKTGKSSISGEKGSIISSGNQEPDDLNGHNTLEHISESIYAAPVHGNGCHPANNKTKESTMPLPEDEAPQKMRDLQEFGLRTIPLKRKFSSSFKANAFDRSNNHCQAHTTSAGGSNKEGDNLTKFVDDRKASPKQLIKGDSTRDYYRCPPAVQVSQNNENLSSISEFQPQRHVGSLYVSAPNQIKDAYWGKRNRCMYLPAESTDYLGNISESSPTRKQVSPFLVRESKFPHHASASDDNTSGLEDTESDSSSSDESETDSDEMNAVSGRGGDGLIDSKEGSEAEGRFGNMSNEELDDLSLADEIPLSADDGVSKWKYKGKRNVRHTSKRSSDILNARVGMNDHPHLESRGNTFHHRISRNNQQSNGFGSYPEGDDSFDRDYWSPESALGNTRYLTLRNMPRGRINNNNIHTYDWDAVALEHRTPLNGYLMETRDYYTSEYNHQHVQGRRRNMLVEVDLKVQSSYPKKRVPIISLMSKIDGRAIIGHSLQIEELEEGSSDTLLSKRSQFGNGRLQGEVNYALPSMWKTARRTVNYHVPRPDLSSAVDGLGDADYLPRGRKSASRNLSTNAATLMQYDSCVLHHIPAIKPSKRSSKKVSISSSQKTKTLSSFSVDHHKQQIEEGRHDVQAFSPLELIKSEFGPAMVPCIPVNLVFSRLYEALGRTQASLLAPPSHDVRLD
ncbi:hypothetical protein QQ045_014635 [Rhodiola kirilowii]